MMGMKQNYGKPETEKEKFLNGPIRTTRHS